MARSLKKGPYIDPKLMVKIERLRGDKSQPIKTWSRRSTISPEMIGYTFLVHNGKEFISVKIREAMIGHKLGEFSPSTKFYRHGGRIQKELEKKATTK
ncbi:MAG: 30S ribosomal protein S19 [Patescibacteria group bacterium]|nr:30S ribosomal protein S19 [Patescibacteria group bacterium]